MKDVSGETLVGVGIVGLVLAFFLAGVAAAMAVAGLWFWGRYPMAGAVLVADFATVFLTVGALGMRAQKGG